jgi:hypothetical protein
MAPRQSRQRLLRKRDRSGLFFYEALSPTSGPNGFFNEPRTFGVQGQITF